MAEPPKTDEALMRAYQGGDADAFETLYRRYERRLFTFLARLVGDRDVAEELFQETFSRVISGAARWKPSAPFASWVFRIARNLALDHLKSHAVRFTETAEIGGAGIDPPGDNPSPEARAADAQARARLLAAIAALPPEQREVLLMRESGGLSFEEIAGAVGHSVSTVKSQMRYALGHLRKALERAGVGKREALGDG